MRRLKVWGGIKWVLMRMSKNKKDVEGGLVIAFFFFFCTGSYGQLPISGAGSRDSVISNSSTHETQPTPRKGSSNTHAMQLA